MRTCELMVPSATPDLWSLCRRPASWHVLVDGCHAAAVQAVSCDVCYPPAVLLTTVCGCRIVASHPLRTPDCTHPDRAWHDDGCAIPTTTITTSTDSRTGVTV